MAAAEPTSVFAKLLAARPSAFTDTIVAESKHTVVFLDKFPMVEGHMLVVPKREVLSMGELSPTEAADFGIMMARASSAVTATTGAVAYNLVAHVGREAGQDVMHFHMHVLPRVPHDFGRKLGLLGSLERHRNEAVAPKQAPMGEDGLTAAQSGLCDRLRAALTPPTE